MNVRKIIRGRWAVAVALACVVGAAAVAVAIALSSDGGRKSAVLPQAERGLVMQLAAMESSTASSPQQKKAMLLRLQPFAQTLHVKPAQLEQMVEQEALVLKARAAKAQASEPSTLRVARTLTMSLHSVSAPASRGPVGGVEDMSFLNPQHGFLVSFVSTATNTGTARIEATSDGGVSWATVWIRGHTNLSWIGFADKRHGFASGIASPSSSTQQPLLLRTDDGGRSWQTITPSLPASPRGSWSLTTARGSWGNLDFQFPSNQIGFAEPNPDYVYEMSEAPILRTGDGGRRWTIVRSPGVTFTAVDFLDPSHGYATGLLSGRRSHSCPSAVFATSDSGSHWRLLRASCRHYELTAIDFLDARTGFAGGDEPYYSSANGQGFQAVLGTTNGGRSWRTLFRGTAERGSGHPIVTLRFSDPLHGIASTGGCKNGEGGGAVCGGSVLSSADGGRRWHATSVAAGQIAAAGAGDVWVVPPCWDGCGVIFRTQDGDRSWQPVARPENVGYSSLLAVGRSLLLGSPAGTFRSLDGGKTWRSFAIPTPPGAVPWAQSIFGSGVVASLETTKISVSHDGGKSWVSASPSLSNGYGISAVAFENSLHGLAAQEGVSCSINGEQASRLFSTSDGGKTWQELPTPTFEIEQLAAAPDLVVAIGGGAVCGQSLLAISHDLGRSWTLRTLPQGASCSPSVAAPETIWLSCGTYLLASTDGGASWSKLGRKHLSIASAAPAGGDEGWLISQAFGAGESPIATPWRTDDGGRTWSERWPALPIVGTS